MHGQFQRNESMMGVEWLSAHWSCILWHAMQCSVINVKSVKYGDKYSQKVNFKLGCAAFSLYEHAWDKEKNLRLRQVKTMT